jgi:hypothetical protein
VRKSAAAAIGRFLELADLVRVDVSLDTGPGGVRCLTGSWPSTVCAVAQ